MNAIVNFTQIVKQTTCLMAITQPIPISFNLGLNEASLEKRNHFDELINIPPKAEERSMIQISFRTQDPNIRQAQSGIRVKNNS